jgi:hypothetical protein
MMQRKLHDPTDAAKIWRKSTLQEADAGEDDIPDLLGTLEGEDVVNGRVVKELGDFEEDGPDEFEDLLSGDDGDGLLDYLEERERLLVEWETEEMLFGSGWDDPRDEEDEYLLDDEARSDDMLL